jgi:hypothetical protein
MKTKPSVIAAAVLCGAACCQADPGPGLGLSSSASYPSVDSAANAGDPNRPVHSDATAAVDVELAGTAATLTIATPTVTPGTVTPGTVTPGTVTPGTATPGTATPGTATPGTATPGTATPGTATPGTVTPGTVTPGTVTPGTVTPGTVTPGSTDDPPSVPRTTRLKAVLEPVEKSGASGTIVFQANDTGLNLTLNVVGLKPNTRYTVMINMQAGAPQTDPSAPRFYPHPLESRVSDSHGTLRGVMTAKDFSLTTGDKPVLGRAVSLHSDAVMVAVGAINTEPQ